MVGLDESSLRVLANDGTFRNKQGIQPYINTPIKAVSEALPHDGVGNDNDSLGVFQQRAIDGSWAPVGPGPKPELANLGAVAKWLMNPAYSAEAFFAMPAGKGDTKALVNVSGWQNMSPWIAAQAVQVSGDPTGSNYKREMPTAQGYIDKYYDSSPAVPLPAPLATNSSTPTPTPVVPGSGATGTNACGGPDVALVNCNTVGTGTSATTTPAPTTTSTTGVSTVRATVTCLAKHELSLWKNHTMFPGYRRDSADSYTKYSQNVEEFWCADFTSWIYKEAGYPIGPSSQNWREAAVLDIRAIGEREGNFHWHPSGSNYTPKLGDLAIHIWPNGDGQHINIVVGVDTTKGRIDLIGGDQGHGPNTSYPNGAAVSEYSTTFEGDSIVGYVTPD